MLARIKNKTTEFREKINELFIENPYLPKMLVVAFVGFLFSLARAFSALSSFGVAYVASVPFKYIGGAVIGVLLGYIIFGQEYTLAYISATILAGVINYIISRKRRRHPLPRIYPSIISGVSMACFSLITVYAKGFMLYDIASSLAEIILSMGSAFFISQAVLSIKNGKSFLITERDRASMVITGAIIVMGLCRLNISDISIGRIVAVYVILISAYIGAEKGGVLIGTIAGFSISLLDIDMLPIIACFSVAGLVAGCFSEFEKLGVACGFVISNAMLTIFLKDSLPSTILYEVMGATLIYMLTPHKIIDKIKYMFYTNSPPDESRGIKASVASRLNFASCALIDVSKTVTAVCERLRTTTTDDVSSIYEQVADRVCRSCGMKTYCWQKNYTDTMNRFNDITTILKKRGRLYRNDMPEYFLKECPKSGALFEEINITYSDYVAKRSALRRISDVRTVVAEQFSAIGETLSHLALDVEHTKGADATICTKVKTYLKKYNTEAKSIVATRDIFGRTSLELCFVREHIKKINHIMLALDLSEICGKCFDIPAQSEAGNLIKLTFFEKAGYCVNIGAYQLSKGDNKFCGDSYDHFLDAGGRARLIVSDGMGSGGAAAIDSSMAAALLSKLLCGGFGFDASLKIVNSALLVKSGDESIATIDAADIDLYTGMVDFYKAGAPVSFIRKRDRAEVVDSESLPAGILRGISFDKKSVRLSDGDMVLLVSDGVVTSGYDWILSELDLYKSDDAQYFAKRIATEARRRRLDGFDDDITVLCAIIKKGV